MIFYTVSEGIATFSDIGWLSAGYNQFKLCQDVADSLGPDFITLMSLLLFF